MVVENEPGVANENRNMNYSIPKKDQIYSTKKTEEQKALFQDIFNVNNPKPYSYKPE